ncbi:hypothetical protein [Burkholderia sp. PU8-34]
MTASDYIPSVASSPRPRRNAGFDYLESKQGIHEHVEWNALVNWVAMDDNDDGWPREERHHLGVCAPEFGLSRLLTELELRERLLCFSGGGRS